MQKKSKVEFKMDGLVVMKTALEKMTKEKYHIQVGIFGDKTVRQKGGTTNAEVGFVHEMGSRTRHIPRRSFLWDTLHEHGKELTEAIKGYTQTMFKTGKVTEYLDQCGREAHNLVQKAFDTGGFGKWAPLSIGTLMGKLKGAFVKRQQQAAEDHFEGGHNAAILIKTGQLRRAIAWRTVQ